MKIEITKEVRSRMLVSLKRARRREIGGILMAEQVSPGFFRIVDFSLDEKSGSTTQFFRHSELHQNALDSFFLRTGNDFARYNYIGEWHSHPNHHHAPSRIDILSMLDLIKEEGDIPFAILLIVKRRWWSRLYCTAMLFRQGEDPRFVEVSIEA